MFTPEKISLFMHLFSSTADACSTESLVVTKQQMTTELGTKSYHRWITPYEMTIQWVPSLF